MSTPVQGCLIIVKMPKRYLDALQVSGNTQASPQASAILLPRSGRFTPTQDLMALTIHPAVKYVRASITYFQRKRDGHNAWNDVVISVAKLALVLTTSNRAPYAVTLGVLTVVVTMLRPFLAVTNFVQREQFVSIAMSGRAPQRYWPPPNAETILLQQCSFHPILYPVLKFLGSRILRHFRGNTISRGMSRPPKVTESSRSFGEVLTSPFCHQRHQILSIRMHHLSGAHRMA